MAPPRRPGSTAVCRRRPVPSSPSRRRARSRASGAGPGGAVPREPRCPAGGRRRRPSPRRRGPRPTACRSCRSTLRASAASHPAPRMEAVAIRDGHRDQVCPQGAQGEPRLDHRVTCSSAALPPRHLRRAGLRARSSSGSRKVTARAPASGCRGEQQHHLALGRGCQATVSEPTAGSPTPGHRGAHLLPPAAGPQGHVELLPGTPATHPHQAEVAHRRAPRCRIGLEVVDREARPAPARGRARSPRCLRRPPRPVARRRSASASTRRERYTRSLGGGAD